MDDPEAPRSSSLFYDSKRVLYPLEEQEHDPLQAGVQGLGFEGLGFRA